MEILIGYQTPQVEESGVSPVGGKKQVSRSGAGLQSHWKPQAISTCQAGPACGKFWPQRDGRLRGASA